MYNLHVNGLNGALDNALKQNNRHKISTFDSKNDSHQNNCASIYFGGWWFSDCFITHLNGKYHSAGKMVISSYNNVVLTDSGIHWWSTGFNERTDSLIFTEMKIRKFNYTYLYLPICHRILHVFLFFFYSSSLLQCYGAIIILEASCQPTASWKSASKKAIWCLFMQSWTS